MSRCRLFQVGKNPPALDVGRFKYIDKTPNVLVEKSGVADFKYELGSRISVSFA